VIICICHRISEGDIERAAAAGCGSFAALQAELGIGTQCGRCLDCAHDTFRRHGGVCHGACDACAREAEQRFSAAAS
jgi:bacterioferritin-associated ferredoxin